MRTLFLTSSGLNAKTAALFWSCIGKEPAKAKVILVPSAAVGNDGAREGISVCLERLLYMGIAREHILIYHLGFLLSDGYERTYSGYMRELPMPFRRMTEAELGQYDAIVFCGGNARTLLDEVNRTGFSEPLKQAIDSGLVYLGISAGSMIASGIFPDGLGYVSNPLMPHAERNFAEGDVPEEEMIALADGQMLWIRGDHREILS